jgi:hypothetical protein
VTHTVHRKNFFGADSAEIFVDVVFDIINDAGFESALYAIVVKTDRGWEIITHSVEPPRFEDIVE